MQAASGATTPCWALERIKVPTTTFENTHTSVLTQNKEAKTKTKKGTCRKRRTSTKRQTALPGSSTAASEVEQLHRKLTLHL